MSIPLEQPTFRVEIDFCIATLRDWQHDPEGNVPGEAPVLRIPSEAKSKEAARKYTLDKVDAMLERCVRELPKPRPVPGMSESRNVQHTSLDPYRNWRPLENNLIQPPTSEAYRYIGIKVNSPVQYACPMGFDAIKFVVSSITKQFRCTLNPSCGLRVHVGIGSERLSLDQIRRVASLSYAVEPFLFTLHDPLQRANGRCAPVRYFSPLAAGKDMKTSRMAHDGNPHSACYRYFERERRHGELPLSSRERDAAEQTIEKLPETRKPGHFEPFNGLPDPADRELQLRDIELELACRIATAQPLPLTGPEIEGGPRRRNIPRIPLPPEEPKLLYHLAKELEPYFTEIPSSAIAHLEKCGGGSSTKVFDAARLIYAQPGSCYVAKLCGSDGFAINFFAYHCWGLNADRTSERAIGFMLAEGSLDGEWIATWAKICAGLFHFALRASPGDFVDFLAKCHQGIVGYGAVDVVDLLDHVGLFAEAEIVERRLMDDMERLGLDFDPLGFYC